MAASLLGPWRGLRCAPAFAACLAREAEAVAEAIGAQNLLFQVEALAEVVAAHRLPRPFVRVPTGPVLDLVRRLPAAVPVGIHLCFGDLNNTAAVAPNRFRCLGAFTNALTRRWPPTHDLSYVHLPFAAGTSPAPEDPTAYRALRRLALPPGTRLGAGFIHEQPPPESLETRLPQSSKPAAPKSTQPPPAASAAAPPKQQTNSSAAAATWLLSHTVPSERQPVS